MWANNFFLFANCRLPISNFSFRRSNSVPSQFFFFFILSPTLEYNHPANSAPRPVFFNLDIGAHEFTALGISKIENDFNFSFFVSHHTLNLVFDSDKNAFAKIIDLNGRNVKEEKITKGKSEIDISKLEPGIYVLEIISERQRKSGIFFLQ